MSVLPRAKGTPEPAAKRLIEQIAAYAAQPATDDIDDNIARLRGLHHIYDAARDALDVGLAIMQQAPHGKVSFRVAAAETGIHPSSVANHIDKGRQILKEAS